MAQDSAEPYLGARQQMATKTTPIAETQAWKDLQDHVAEINDT